MLEVDTSVLATNSHSSSSSNRKGGGRGGEQDDVALHRDMSIAYPKFDEYEIIKGRKLKKFGNFASIYEIKEFVTNPKNDYVDDNRHNRGDTSATATATAIESRSSIVHSDSVTDRYVIKTLTFEKKKSSTIINDYYNNNDFYDDRDDDDDSSSSNYYYGNENYKYLETEIRILSNMYHPNIVRLKATSGNSRTIFFLLERLQETLTMRIDKWKEKECRLLFSLTKNSKKNKRKDIVYEEKIHIAYDVISAIGHLHKHYIIHRDIKPDNLAFDSLGNIKLCNFSLARELKQEQQQQQQQQYSYHGPERTYKNLTICGTPRYMAPEVGLGKPYNASCDIYSFSILLGQMLTCEIPYEDLTTIREIQNYVWDAAEPTRPNLLLEGNSSSSSSMIPETLQYMIRQGWSGNPQMRPNLLEIKNFLMDEMINSPEQKKVMEWLTADTCCDYCKRIGAKLDEEGRRRRRRKTGVGQAEHHKQHHKEEEEEVIVRLHQVSFDDKPPPFFIASY